MEEVLLEELEDSEEIIIYELENEESLDDEDVEIIDSESTLYELNSEVSVIGFEEFSNNFIIIGSGIFFVLAMILGAIVFSNLFRKF